MRKGFRMFRRGNVFWAQNNETGKQESLQTHDRPTALRLLNAKNEAHRQPIINLQIARAYLSASDPQIAKRTWGNVMDEMLKSKRDKRAATQRRYGVAIKDKNLDAIRTRPLMETRAEHFLRVLEAGKISTNIYLRRIHNFELGMNWLPVPVLAQRMRSKSIVICGAGAKPKFSRISSSAGKQPAPPLTVW
jgi:hypothetical protein